MSYDVNDPDLVSLQVINPSKSEHENDVVTNVFYGGMNKKKAAKKAHDKNEAFYKWMRSLNPQMNSDVRIETHHFEYTKKEDKR